MLVQCTLGTNPISVAAPASGGDSFVLDMATSAVALGKVRTRTHAHTYEYTHHVVQKSTQSVSTKSPVAQEVHTQSRKQTQKRLD